MNIITKSPLPRRDLKSFIPTPRAQDAFEAVQQDTINMNDAISTAQFLTLETEPSLGAERIFTPVVGDLVGTDGGANNPYTLALARTAVLAGNYGDASHFVTITIDPKGRVTGAAGTAAISDNVAEGTANLYFTQARARGSVSDGTGLDYVAGTGVFSATPAGTYGAPTGALARSAFSTYAAPTISNPPTQAEVQAVANAAQVNSQTLAALITDLKANGNLS